MGKFVGRRRKFSRPSECNDLVSFRNGISAAAIRTPAQRSHANVFMASSKSQTAASTR